MRMLKNFSFDPFPIWAPNRTIPGTITGIPTAVCERTSREATQPNSPQISQFFCQSYNTMYTKQSKKDNFLKSLFPTKYNENLLVVDFKFTISKKKLLNNPSLHKKVTPYD